MTAAKATTCRDAIRKYWPTELQNQAIALATMESGLRADAHNGNALTGDDSWGCFQGNRYGYLAASRPSAEWFVDPDNNAKWAYELYRAQGWKPWNTSAHKLGWLK